VKLRPQLLLATLLVAALPLLGLQFVRQVEQLLRSGQEQALIDSAAALGAVLQSGGLPASESNPLYVHRAGPGLFLDGYGDDWAPWLDRVERYAPDRREEADAAALPGPEWPLQLALADSAAGLHLWLRAWDERTLFALDPQRPGETLILMLQGPGQGARSIEIAPAAPGRFTRTTTSGETIHGDWQVNASGWSLELRLPPRDRPEALGLNWLDLDTRDQAPQSISSGGLRPLIARSIALDQRLGALLPNGSRAWLVDASGHVLGHAQHGATGAGQLPAEQGSGFWQALLFQRIAGRSTATVQQLQRDSATSRLIGAEIDRAMATGSGADWVVRNDIDQGQVRVRAAYALGQAPQRGPLLVLERDADALMLLANDAVLRLVGASLLSFLAAAGVLLLFAWRLSQRIRRLQRDAVSAVAADGRVVGQVRAGAGGDELASLSRSVAELLERLRSQQNYLRTLADKLAHELRTPLSMIGSSLDNLGAQLREGEPSDAAATAVWIERAVEGQRRLQRMLQAMSEASRLEESLIDEALTRLDLAALVAEYVDGIRAGLNGARAASGRPEILLDLPAPTVEIEGSADLLAQLLDKLIDNALGFTPADGAIRVRIVASDGRAVLEVDNDGPQIRGGTELFEPMVSHRERTGEVPHLGLGLFIARLVVQRHGGLIRAIALEAGTRIRIDFPLAGQHGGGSQ
jgi:signal transduction histidine kinase